MKKGTTFSEKLNKFKAMFDDETLLVDLKGLTKQNGATESPAPQTPPTFPASPIPEEPMTPQTFPASPIPEEPMTPQTFPAPPIPEEPVTPQTFPASPIPEEPQTPPTSPASPIPKAPVTPQITPEETTPAEHSAVKSKWKRPAKNAAIPMIEEERKYLLNSKSSFFSREAYNMLRTNLSFALAEAGECKMVMITSPMQGEGKSITASNLAITLAEAGHRVLLVDCDLRRPKLGRLLSLKSQVGLSDILIKPSLLGENVLRYRKGLHVILAGSIPPNPSELLNSLRMEVLLEKLRESYDYIVLDTPPIGVVTDAAVLASQTDGVLVVVRTGQSERGPVTQAVEQLEYGNARILGFVMTCVPLEDTNYGYSKYRYKKYGRYGYRRYGKYGYRKYGYGKYGYSKYGYGEGYEKGYGYGGYGYGGYGYGGYGYGYGANNQQENREQWRDAVRDKDKEVESDD